jgi:hypothetical protein
MSSFYSPQTLKMVAERIGYAVLSVDGWHIFSRRPLGATASKALRWALSGHCLNLCRITIEAIPTQTNIERDHRSSLQKIGVHSTLGANRR